MLIRKAKLEDVPALLGMWKKFMRYHYEALMKKRPELRGFLALSKDSKEHMKKSFQKNIRSRKGMVFVVEIRGEIVGYCMIFIKRNPPDLRLRELGYISDLFIEEGFRRIGIASEFRDKAFQWFGKKGIKHVTLNILDNNEYAHDIYRKWGFTDYNIWMHKKI